MVIYVNGTTTTVDTTNTTDLNRPIHILKVVHLTSSFDAGLIVQSGSAHNSGSSFYHINQTLEDT